VTIVKEATARIKINKLLEQADWNFFTEDGKPGNIRLEPGVTLQGTGDNFEKISKGFVDFLLLDSRNSPLIILEAKAEDKDPLIGKEQARKYAEAQKCRFIILSNGNLHYWWDLERGNPEVITGFPTPDSVTGYKAVKPNPQALIDEKVEADFIALIQRPNYKSEAGWKNEDERPDYIKNNNLRFLRPYQLKALYRLQAAVNEGKDRFLFEMATGTGKTLTSAAVIKLFLCTKNARRILFLVDRLELEDQAKKAFVNLLSKDYTTVIYKENKSDWNKAEVVVTTVQSLLFNNKYQRDFSPTDFDLVISDEAHRSIGGNARAVFDYFVGYKLGLTATPRDYLKKFEQAVANSKDPREAERRLLLDTYRTFGCETGQPTFRYSLLDGVNDNFLINPTVVDARTDITTELLSEQGYTVTITDDQGQESEETYKQTDLEKKFFSEATNQLLCKTFLENALKDPISGEIGKSIVFAVSQSHASKLTQILNLYADQMFPGKYQSNFAVQVTSLIPDAQQFTINFANNNLLGSANFIDTYKTSKARVCVTVGMMTTGYDCPDILNLGLFRPIFSPTDFIQIKGRGTRKHDFTEDLFDDDRKDAVTQPNKATFKLFDFFANCEYFETQFNYDEVLKLPKPEAKKDPPIDPPPLPPIDGLYEYQGSDTINVIKEEVVSNYGMKIDRMFFSNFESTIKEDKTIVEAIEAGQWDRVIDYVNREIFDKPDEFYSLEKLRKAADVDRRITLREILEKVFGLIPRFKSKDELLEEEFSKFVADHVPPDPANIPAIKHYFKAYIISDKVRDIIDQKDFTALATNPALKTKDYRAVPEEYRTLVPQYVRDYVTLNQFSA
jgi:type I restriction enzyme R subunit